LDNIPFLASPKLLLFIKDLVSLQLQKIPQLGYISPYVMVTCLASLTEVEKLGIGFLSRLHRSDLSSQPPSVTVTRVESSLEEFSRSSSSTFRISERLDILDRFHGSFAA
jgi:hypothetical protein